MMLRCTPLVRRQASRRKTLSFTDGRLFNRSQHTIADGVEKDGPKIISRRVWEAHKQDLLRKNLRQPFLRKQEPPVEWPMRVRYTFYVVVAGLVPYFGTWYLCSTQSTRDWLLPKLSPEWQERLRSHFGDEDVDAISYVEIVEEGMAAPSQFPNDWSERERKQQAVVEAYEQDDLPVKLYIVENDETTVTIDDSVQNVTGATLASSLPSLTNSTANQVVAVAFPEEPEPMADDNVKPEQDLAPHHREPLLSQVHTYSSWHYQSAAPSISTNSDASFSDYELQRSKLEHEIQGYEAELRGASVRPVDDIMTELNKAKSQLRWLRWKRFMPWTS